MKKPLKIILISLISLVILLIITLFYSKLTAGNTRKEELAGCKGDGYFIYKERVKFCYFQFDWRQAMIVDGAQITSFQPLNDYYAKDNNHVYADGKILNEADPKTFQSLKYNFAKDNSFVFNNEKILSGVDPKTFEILDLLGPSFFAKDKNWIYHFFNGHLFTMPEVDSSSFTLINNSYAKDKNNVYEINHKAKNLEILEGANPETFIP